MKNKEPLVEVYRSRTPIEAQVIKSLLESFGIPSVLQSNAAPSVHVLTVDGMSAVSVLVLSSAAEQARELISAEPSLNPEGETPE